jgi:hypothetical protein
MASPIEDPGSLPGKTLNDQMSRKIGEIKDLYTAGEDDTPAWVSVETTIGMADKRIVFVPIARLKEEDDEIRVPYTMQRVQSSPEIEPEDQLSAENDRILRDFYAIDLADQEIRTDNESYAANVHESGQEPSKADS